MTPKTLALKSHREGPKLRQFVKISLASLGALATALLAFGAYAASAISEREFDTAFKKLKREDSLQFELPAALPPPTVPAWLEAILKFIGAIFEFLAPFFYYIFWLGLIALAAGAIYLIAKILMDVERAKKVETAAPEPIPLYQPSQKAARILLDEIDALAAQGRFSEAVHTLLFRSIQDIDRARPNVIRRSLTSREIGALSILSSGARGAFSKISAIVETSFFGGQDIGKSEFDAARAAYTQIAEP